MQDRLKFIHSFLRNAFIEQFFIYLFQTNFIEFVDGNGNVYNAILFANHFGNSGQNLTVVNFHNGVDFQLRENGINNLHQLHFVEQRIAAHNIDIALVKFAVTAFLRAIGTPNRLNLVTFKRERNVVAVLHHEAGKGHR